MSKSKLTICQAMISYLLQTITTFLSGPIHVNFAMIFELGIAKPSGFYVDFYKSATNNAHSAATTNIFVSLSVAAACIIGNAQVPPMAEHNFIVNLEYYQMYRVLALSLPLMIYRSFKEVEMLCVQG